MFESIFFLNLHIIHVRYVFMLMNLNTKKQFLEFAMFIFFYFKHGKIFFFYSALNLHSSKNMGIKVNVYMTTCISVIWALDIIWPDDFHKVMLRKILTLPTGPQLLTTLCNLKKYEMLRAHYGSYMYINQILNGIVWFT